MGFVLSSELSEDDALDYMKMYNATVALLTDTIELFKDLAKSSPDAADRELYRKKVLEAEREIELLESKLAAFKAGTSLVRRPTDAEIKTAQGLAEKLADLAAAHARAQALVRIVDDGVKGFKKVNATA